tara:strand:+ start:1094 stop:1489 length:396 start_codon:yes stop_codon:yes gene_type:complete
MQLLPGSNPIPTPEQRRIPRHQLSAYLAVINSLTGRPFGYIGNLSPHGVMLICALPVMLNEEYHLELHLPEMSAKEYPRVIRFRARSRWCRADVAPGHYDCGFSISHNREAFAGLARALQRYFTFGDFTGA